MEVSAIKTLILKFLDLDLLVDRSFFLSSECHVKDGVSGSRIYSDSVI